MWVERLVVIVPTACSSASSRRGTPFVRLAIPRKHEKGMADPMQNADFATSEPVWPPNALDLRSLTDEQLLAALQAGLDDSLAILFDRYHRLVYSIAMKIVRDSGEAEDVMQNVFFEIFRAVAQFDPSRGTCRAWLLQFAYHRAINRKQQLNAKYFYNFADMENVVRTMPERSSALGRFSHSELKYLMKQGLATLNAAQRRAIELATYQGLSMQEIAVNTGESLVNVRHHYYRGLKKLRSFVDCTRPEQTGASVGIA